MRSLLVSGFLLLIATGCSVTTYNRSVTHGKIENPDIVITAQDQSFTIKNEFLSPFQSSTRYNSLEVPDRDLPKAYRQAIHHGAKHVRIKVPGSEKELFGVLALDKVDDEGVGPTTQSYKIILPQPYIDAAKMVKFQLYTNTISLKMTVLSM